jgi:ketol-acid reductoisomerase
MKVYYAKDAPLEPLKNKKIAVIGYGSQGRAQALNLKDSGLDVTIGLRAGSTTAARVKEDGLKTDTVENAVKQADIVMVLLPDENQGEAYAASIKDNLSSGKSLFFSHGFSIHFGQIVPPNDVNVAMVAPKGVGPMVREEYQKGGGVPCLVAVHQDVTGNTLSLALAYANGIGGAKSGIIETTFRNETETDLFGEQAVLCGGMTNLMRAGFETLTEAGYPPEMAYFECIHEMKLIVDLIYKSGLSGMRRKISNTAEYGDYVAGPYVIDSGVKKRMKKVLKNIRSGKFARDWMDENRSGRPSFDKTRAEWEKHPLEKTGAELRGMMNWLINK